MVVNLCNDTEALLSPDFPFQIGKAAQIPFQGIRAGIGRHDPPLRIEKIELYLLRIPGFL